MSLPPPQPLAGRRVAVTRATDQASTLSQRLGDLGAEVLQVPTIAIDGPDDGGRRLAEALSEHWDWIVVTSPNGAERTLEAGAVHGPVAAVGPGTAAVLRAAGVEPQLIASRAIGESLVEDFPAGFGRVLVAQGDRARPVVVEGLRDKGWIVTPVVAYRTVAVAPPPDLAASVSRCDAITFLSASSVEACRALDMPAIVVCIGPITAAAARAAGITVTAVAEFHTIDGVIAALLAVLS